MDKLTKKQTNKIIIMIVIIMLCNFAMPNYAHAFDGGIVFKYAVPIVLMIPDLLIEKLQQIFVADDAEIAIEDPKGGISHYSIMYSPGAIFSGRIAGFDVNFISPRGDENGIVETEYDNYKYEEIELDEEITYDILKDEFGLPDNIRENLTYSDIGTYILWFRTRCGFLYLANRRYARRRILLVP